MRNLIYFLLACTIMAPKYAGAEDNRMSFNTDPVVEALNTISARLDKQKLTSSDITVIADAACKAMGAAQSEGLPANMASFLNKVYAAEPNVVDDIDQARFIEAESTYFRKLGASMQVEAFLARELKDNFVIPATSPALDGGIEDEISNMKQVSCELSRASGDSQVVVSDAQQDPLARALGLAVLGLGAMVIDAFFAVEMPGVMSGTIAAGSMGWGWNRVEEANSRVKELQPQ